MPLSTPAVEISLSQRPVAAFAAADADAVVQRHDEDLAVPYLTGFPRTRRMNDRLES